MLRFVGSGDEKKFTQNPGHFSMQNSQANLKKKSTKVFWRAGKVMVFMISANPALNPLVCVCLSCLCPFCRLRDSCHSVSDYLVETIGLPEGDRPEKGGGSTTYYASLGFGCLSSRFVS